MVILATIAILIWAGAFFWMWDTLADPVIAAIMTALITVVLLPILWPRRER